jgi:hypothetical protein
MTLEQKVKKLDGLFQRAVEQMTGMRNWTNLIIIFYPVLFSRELTMLKFNNS